MLLSAGFLGNLGVNIFFVSTFAISKDVCNIGGEIKPWVIYQ